MTIDALHIGPFLYTVVFRETVRADDGTERLGQCDLKHLRIEVSTDMSEDRIPETIMHEALHAIDFAVQIGLSEKQIARLSPALVDLMRRNPEFLSLIGKS